MYEAELTNNGIFSKYKEFYTPTIGLVPAWLLWPDKLLIVFSRFSKPSTALQPDSAFPAQLCLHSSGTRLLIQFQLGFPTGLVNVTMASPHLLAPLSIPVGYTDAGPHWTHTSSTRAGDHGCSTAQGRSLTWQAGEGFIPSKSKRDP